MFDHLCGIIDCCSAVVVSDQLSSSLASLFDGRVVDDLYKQACYQRKKGELNEAVSTFSKVLRLQPNHAKACLGRGVTYVQLENVASAIADYRQALKLDLDWANAWLRWGTVLLQPNHYSDAIQAFSQAIRLKPDSPNAYIACGFAYHSQEKFSTAIAYYAQAIRLSSTSGLAFLLRGAAREQMSDSQWSTQDIHYARELYRKQNDEASYQAALKLLKGVT